MFTWRTILQEGTGEGARRYQKLNRLFRSQVFWGNRWQTEQQFSTN